MPLFGGHRKDRRRSSAASTTPSGNTPTLPPPPPPPSEPQQRTPPKSMIPSRDELTFHCQLAHGSSTKEIKDFSNVKELYTRIAEAFGISPESVIFCTLNTHKVDMARLLGGQIGLEDFIFAHVHGHTKEIRVTKSEPALGLTITDNGTGYPFVKRIKEGSLISQVKEVLIGDHIESINGQSMVGSRHYEVAKLLKELPQYTEFSLRLVEPRKAFDAIAPRGSSSKAGASSLSVLEGDTSKLEQAVSKGEGRATLRLKKDGQAVVEEVTVWEVKAAEKVDELLESFIGIRDLELAQSMVDMSKAKASRDDFAVVMDQNFAEFEFPDDFVTDVWSIIQTTKMARK